MDDRMSAAESRGASSGVLFQGFLEALQQRTAKTSSEEVSTEATTSTDGSSEDAGTWRQQLFVAQKKKLKARWEHYSPTLKEKLPRKFRELFERQPNDEEGMADTRTRLEGDIIQGRQNKYKKIAAFYLEETKVSGSSQDEEEEYLSQEKVPLEEECEATQPSEAIMLRTEKPPFIVLQEADPEPEPEPLPVEPDVKLRRKSPLTVQEWVDHLPVKPKLGEKENDEGPVSGPAAECEPPRRLVAMSAARLSREASVQSSSSLDSLLDARRPDPVEVLLNLGFGGVPGVDLDHCRIPKRFLVPSKCKGGDWNEFLRRELLQVQNFECASLGFRGLSGPNHQRPSAIVANIMEKLRERTAPRPAPAKARFSAVARRVLNETAVVNRLSVDHHHHHQQHQQHQQQSVLSPDNRKFLDSQGKVSPEVPRRRIIFGQKSFAFAQDGELVEVDPSVPSGSSTSAESDSEDPRRDRLGAGPGAVPGADTEGLRSPEALLKLRRSSLQRQKRVEDSAEGPGDHLEGKQEPICEVPAERGVKRREIPPRFLSLGCLNLRGVAAASASASAAAAASKQASNGQPDNLRQELEAEMKSLSHKIQFASSQDLSSILRQMKELRSRLDSQ